MAIVTEYDWESNTWTHHTAENEARQAWREAVQEIADKAKAKLPECNGRLESAVKLVLAGDVEFLADGTAKVASQSNGTTAYHVVNGTCHCRDFDKAPHNLCKHRLSAAIARRAQELTKAKHDAPATGQAAPPSQPAQPEAPTVPLPEAPVSITLKATLHGHEVLVTLRGVDCASVKAQVEEASTWWQAHGSQTADTPPQCPKHGAMKPSTKGTGWYCPHKLADGSWCKGK
jgi:hypothetical protein